MGKKNQSRNHTRDARFKRNHTHTVCFIMNSQEKKLDISAGLYVLIIIAAFAVGILL